MLEIQRSTAPLGAEILGVDLSKDIDDAVFREIVDLFHEHEVIWDNCSTQHRAVMDYQLPQRRLMERATLCGTAPF